jgi:hypothetical protein
MNTGYCFPPLRIVEEKMTNHEIQQTFNTAFGGDAVEKVVKSKNTRIIRFDQSNEQRMYLWDEFYEALDEYGAVWIKSEYLGDEEYPQTHIVFSKVPKEGHWEVKYAKKTPPRRSTTSSNPRVDQDGKLRHSPVRVPVPVPAPSVKVCTCGCTCGARMGTTF